MVRWLLWAVGALLLGVLAGIVGGLVRRRPVPESVSYLAPRTADGRQAVGPHRAVLRAARP